VDLGMWALLCSKGKQVIIQSLHLEDLNVVVETKNHSLQVTNVTEVLAHLQNTIKTKKAEWAPLKNTIKTTKAELVALRANLPGSDASDADSVDASDVALAAAAATSGRVPRLKIKKVITENVTVNVKAGVFKMQFVASDIDFNAVTGGDDLSGGSLVRLLLESVLLSVLANLPYGGDYLTMQAKKRGCV